MKSLEVELMYQILKIKVFLLLQIKQEGQNGPEALT